jgi:predicted enzyme related to lactoylglutathione lyase
MFKSLDYLYVPAKDIELSISYYTEQLDGKLLWKVHAFETWVAAIQLADRSPQILLASHLAGTAPLPIYQVEQIDESIRSLKKRGWKSDRIVELPNGPCYLFQDPTGVHLAIYENLRPDPDRKFEGIFDT